MRLRTTTRLFRQAYLRRHRHGITHLDPTVAGRDMPALPQRDAVANKNMKGASKTASQMLTAMLYSNGATGLRGTRAGGVEPRRFWEKS